MNRISSFCLIALTASLFVCAAPSSSHALSKQRSGCTGTINSINDVQAATQCTNVVINSFTVPAGRTLDLALLDSTIVNLHGDIAFGNKSWSGPLVQISGNYVTFNGNGNRLDGGGFFHWDGQGSNGGSQKPRPMIKVKMSGTFNNTIVVNSPAQAISVGNSDPLLISGVTIDDSQGDQPNKRSKGKPAGHNTDGFDISANDVTIENCVVINQDDCIAINEGSNIVFQNNKCKNGHGMSIGSISSGKTVNNVLFKDNTVVNSDQAIRIKTDKSASGSYVKDITYIGNNASGIKRFGVLIDQSYPSTLGQPGSGVKIENIQFTGNMNRLTVDDSAVPVAINCGLGSCLDSWNFSSLETTGGTGNKLANNPTLTGYNGGY